MSELERTVKQIKEDSEEEVARLQKDIDNYKGKFKRTSKELEETKDKLEKERREAIFNASKAASTPAPQPMMAPMGAIGNFGPGPYNGPNAQGVDRSAEIEKLKDEIRRRDNDMMQIRQQYEGRARESMQKYE